jgi:hypothetical protein
LGIGGGDAFSDFAIAAALVEHVGSLCLEAVIQEVVLNQKRECSMSLSNKKRMFCALMSLLM